MTATANTPGDMKQFVFSNGGCTIGSDMIRCVAIKHHHALNEIPVAEIHLGVDTDTEGLPSSIQDLYTLLFSKKKGDDVVVAFQFSASANKERNQRELASEPVIVFRGKLLGWAPIWLGPSHFRMVVWAIHPLGLLDWASAVIDPIHGSGFDDHKLPTIIGKSQELVPYMKSPFVEDDVKTDIWKLLIKPELMRICRSARFEKPNCAALVDYLEDTAKVGNDGSEQPLSFKFSNPERVILDIRKRLYTSAVGRKTLWDALVELAGIYKFSIICRSFDFSIAPVLMALAGDAPASCIMYSADYVPREEYNSLVRDIAQSTGMMRGLGGTSSFFDTEARKRQLAFQSTEGEPVIAGTDFSMTPRFMDFDGEPFFRSGRTMGLKEEQLFASGYKMDKDAPEAPTLNKQYNAVPDDELQKYEAIVQNERGFSGPTAIMKGLINYSISPGNLVIVEPPMRYQSGEKFSTMYFANVHAVTNILDATTGSGQNGTYAILTHIRSSDEQKLIPVALKKHPLYDKRWISAPLRNIPGYTEAPQNA